MFYVAKNGPCGVGNLHIVVLKNDSDPVSSNNIHKDFIYSSLLLSANTSLCTYAQSVSLSPSPCTPLPLSLTTDINSFSSLYLTSR